MSTYRTSRNIEASVIDFTVDSLSNGGWNNINVIKGFSRVYDMDLPIVAIRAEDTSWEYIELGSNSMVRTVDVFIDIFATSDGQRLDIKDYLVLQYRNGIDYYEHTIDNGIVSNKTLKGKLIVTNISDTPVNFSVNKELLDKRDRYRHLIVLTVTLNEVE